MTPLETLKAAREKIADEKHWTRSASARDVVGTLTYNTSPTAVCWCASGAILSVCSENSGYEALNFMDKIAGDIRYHDLRPVAAFNDTHTHAEVLALFDKAIAKLEVQS